MKWILIVLFALPAFSQTMSVRPMVNPLEELARQILADRSLGKEQTSLLREFDLAINKRVVSEIEAEAAEAKMDRDKYIEAGLSMDNFLKVLREQAFDINSISDAKALVLVTKSGIRLKIQENIRFIPDGHFEKVDEVRAISGELLRKLKIFINKNEENLNTVIEFLKKNPQVMGQMLLESVEKDCLQGNKLNTYLYSALYLLRNGTTIKVGDEVVRIPGDKNWGYLRKDRPDGGQQIEVDTIAYKTEEGKFKIYDLIHEACTIRSVVPAGNFNIVGSEKTSERIHWTADGINSRDTPRAQGQR